MSWLFIMIASVLMFNAPAYAANEYTIDGTFDGCEYGKLYGLTGGGILECAEYQYFYEYNPRVIASGRRVNVIGNNQVQAQLHNGSIYKTHISGEFNGCDFDKVYRLDNGLIFQCSTYSYAYAYRPAVTIFAIEGRLPIIKIDGKPYAGTLFRSK